MLIVTCIPLVPFQMEDFPGFETKIIDPSGLVAIITIRRATVDDVTELPPNLFDDGAEPPGLYRKANCVEIDSEEDDDVMVILDSEEEDDVMVVESGEVRREVGPLALTNGPSTSSNNDNQAADLLLDFECDGFDSDEDDNQVNLLTTSVPTFDADPEPTPSTSASAPSRQQRKHKRRRSKQRANRKIGQKNLVVGQKEFVVIDAIEVEEEETPTAPAEQMAGTSDGQVDGGFYCPICRDRVSVRVKRHLEANHLPWWIIPERACWQCKRWESSLSNLKKRHSKSCPPAAMTESNATTWVHLSNGLLQVLRENFDCESNAQLLDLVVTRKYYPRDRSPFHLSLEQRLLFRVWEQRNGVTVSPLEEMTVQPPSVVACLLHPKVLACIIAQLSEETANSIATLETKPPGEAPVRLPLMPRTVDAHIHLDRWGKDFRNHLGSSEDCRIRYSSLVAVFAHPNRWNLWDKMSQEDLVCAFGIHPVVCGQQPGVAQRRGDELRQRLTSPRCVALGEVGLDYLRCRTQAQQKKQRDALVAMLGLRPESLPVVVHCRGAGALADCLELLKQHLERDSTVQVHCFLGDRAEVQLWQNAFPQCLFSFGHKSLALIGSAAEEHNMAARGLSLDRILLESDAPYLGRSARVMQMSPGPASPRRDLYQVGEWLGQLKGLCPSVVLEAAGHNAHQAFRIPMN